MNRQPLLTAGGDVDVGKPMRVCEGLEQLAVLAGIRLSPLASSSTRSAESGLLDHRAADSAVHPRGAARP
jgi:hypothetical protein